jgi:hypothetical protein
VDTDGDTLVDPSDNCPAVPNPDQLNAGGPALGDACDTGNSDGDILADNVEYFCGSPANNAALLPERVDTAADDDGDGSFGEALPGAAVAFDCDGDGYTGEAEASIFFPIGARDQDQCGIDGWPSNLRDNPVPPLDSVNTVDILDVTSFLAPVRVLDTSPDDVGVFDPRWDLVPGAGTFVDYINIQDITALFSGTPGFPPMFGGVRAFDQTCPFPP